MSTEAGAIHTEEVWAAEEDSAKDEVDRDAAHRQAARHCASARLNVAGQRIGKKPAQCAVARRRVLPRSHPARRGAPYRKL
jgi:hypothetical protein